MTELLWHPECPKQQKAVIVCLSHNCKQSPFQCQNANCPCSSAHHRCKSMQWKAALEYLSSWKKTIGQDGRQFVSRVEKIFSNVKVRMEKELKLFQDFCKQHFLGKDYERLMYLLDKRQQKSISSSLISSALRQMTEPTQMKSFKSFTVSQMHLIDQTADKLFATLNNLYKSKQQQKIEFDKFKRCSSATLQRGNEAPPRKQKQKHQKTIMADVVQLKLDLSFPKSITSRIVSQASSLNAILNRKVKKYHFVYRASEEEFGISNFYKKMSTTLKHLSENSQKKGHHFESISLILSKNQFGKVLGGFTPLVWQEPKIQADESDQEDINPENNRQNKGKHKFKTDSTARTVLFSLDLMEKYQLKKPEEAIYCGRKSIGFGKGDLKIVERGHSTRKNCCKFPVSYNSLSRPYMAWSKSGMELGGGRYSVFFKVVEWEAFIVEL